MHTFTVLWASPAMMQLFNIIAAFLAIFITWRLTTPGGSRSDQMKRMRNFMIVAVLIFISGVTIYAIGFNYEGCTQNIVALLFRSIMSSLEMFLSHSDLLEVNPEFKENMLYMAIFSVVHFLAVFVNICILFNYVGIQSSSIRNVRKWMKAKEGSNLHIFVGDCTATRTLSRDVRMHEPDAWIIWIPFYEKSENHGHLSFSNIITQVAYRRDLVMEANSVNAVLVRPRNSLEDSLYTENQDQKMHDLGLDIANKLILKALSVNVYLLSDDVEHNIARTQVLCNLKLHRPVKIFCHACRNALNLALESQYGIGQQDEIRPEVFLIDSAQMSVQQLLQRQETSPAGVVDIQEDGTVTSGVSALVIGFGHYGKEILKYLYEYSSFVTPDHKQAPFSCTVTDMDMNTKDGEFWMRSPSMKACADIKLVHAEQGSQAFWDAICEKIESLNYIVVTMSDDIVNIQTAVAIYEQIIRRKSRHKTKIFVRCYTSTHEKYVRSVLDFYNMCSKEDTNCEFIMFGRKKDIFRYDLLFNTYLSYGTKLFYQNYVQYIRKAPVSASLNQATLKQIYATRRQFGTLIAHCLHIPSNLLLSGISDEILGTPETIQQLKDFVERAHAGALTEAERKRLEILAHTEFLRWRARLEADGYIKKTATDTSCSELSREHRYLVDWNEIPNMQPNDNDDTDTDYRKYFYFAVVGGFDIVCKLIEMAHQQHYDYKKAYSLK